MEKRQNDENKYGVSLYKTKKYNNGTWNGTEITLIDEYLLKVYVNGWRQYHIVCSPYNLKELLVGRLITDGLAAHITEIDFLQIDQEKNCARVILSNWNDHTFTTTDPGADNLIKLPLRENHDCSAVRWTPEWVTALSNELQNGEPLYRQTFSVHSCFLMREGNILCRMEDIGRHNALDKVIGWAILNGIELKDCIVFSSGRQPIDMVTKAIRAGVSVLASKSLPTSAAVELAKKHHLTLLHISKRCGFLQLA